MSTLTPEQFLQAAMAKRQAATSDDEVREATTALAAALRAYKITHGIGLPNGPVEQAREVNPKFLERHHLTHIDARLRQAVTDVEAGESRYLCVSLPPRVGKSLTISQHTVEWLVRKHPDWPFAIVSHADVLATGFGRAVRRTIEGHPEFGVQLAPDAASVSDWETTDGGAVRSRGIRSSLTGFGAKVLIIDDPIKDFVEAHSETSREAVWNWWLAVAQLRLEPPALVVVVMTRWHEDDFIGRLLSDEHEGDPADWEVITVPAIAEEGDPIGREVGEPLMSPLLPDETPEEAVRRWAKVKTDVGTYVWSAMYQQHPSPSKGAIFDMGWWRFWTRDPARAEANPDTVLLLEPENVKGGRWLDMWDMAFKGTDGSDYVVGQRWARIGPNRFLIGQTRARRTFTETTAAMKAWLEPESVSHTGAHVHERGVEDKANGPAIIDALRAEIPGLIPIKADISKTARAHGVTPECESGHVYLPHPSDPGNEWVPDLLSELRAFPTGAHDDQVDTLVHALTRLRGGGTGSVSVPGRRPGGQGLAGRSITRTAIQQGARGTGGIQRKYG